MTDSNVGMRFQHLYQEMFRATQAGHQDVADSLRVQIEHLRSSTFPKPSSSQVERVRELLPAFVTKVLGRTQAEIGSLERSNCINAAFNFHDVDVRWTNYSTLEFLARIQNEFSQLSDQDDIELGDLVVLWSRSGGGSWDNKSINVHEMNQADTDFPYGLVFDHVAVRLSEDLIFHKPDPTPLSAYQIDFLHSAIAATMQVKGFELTYHRKI